MRHALVAKGAHDVHERVGILVAGDVHQRLRAAAGGGNDVGESTVAGTRLRGLYIAVSASSRASGTFEMPMLTSPLPRGASRALVIS